MDWGSNRLVCVVRFDPIATCGILGFPAVYWPNTVTGCLKGKHYANPTVKLFIIINCLRIFGQELANARTGFSRRLVDSMNFDWDAKKARKNLRDHRVSFSDAVSVFRDPLSVTVPDPDHSLDENRCIIVGRSKSGQLLMVAHADRHDSVRIISARTLTPSERRQYEEGIS